MKDYRTGCEAADNMIAELVSLCSPGETGFLLHDILTSAVKLGMESRDKGDLKLVNNALKELRYSFKVFSPYRNIKKAVIFGSARAKKSSREYKMAEEFAAKITKKGYMVITGGGPGIMEAGNKGAPGNDFALNIRLPFEQKPNPFINEKERLIYFKYFFTRKLIFIKESNATVLFPGGFGTNDEGFEMLTLIQTGKSAPRPILLMEPRGSSYWKAWIRFVDDHLVRNKYIDRDDMKLFRVVNSVDDAVARIDRFYTVYHSIRYVADLTVFRLNRAISDHTLNRVNREFKDIVTAGAISQSGPTDEEMQRGEFPDLPRLVMKFNRRSYGRLLELIDTINGDHAR
jgi:uncharacterized protein (TIGR00730 family)